MESEVKVRNFIKLCACHERYDRERVSTTNFDKANALTLCLNTKWMPLIFYVANKI